jgi:protein-disulfide isomerase
MNWSPCNILCYPIYSVVKLFKGSAEFSQVHFAFKHYPLPMHKESPLAHEAALAAEDQGKFWEMHDLIFSTQSKLSRDDLIAKAKQLNLDVPRFTRDLDNHRFKSIVDSDRQEGNRLGVDGTPFFFINGHAISGAVGLADFTKLIDAALKESAVSDSKLSSGGGPKREP